MNDYYKLLEVDRGASIEVIEKAYKTLAKKYHPDNFPKAGRAQASERMSRLNEAYAVLKNPGKRRRYDEEIAAPLDVFLNEGLVGLFKQWLEKQHI